MKLKNMILSVLLGFFVISLFSGCVTSTDVKFNTEVDGAKVFIDEEMVGITPFEMTLSNAVWEDPDIIIKKEGYETIYTSLKKEIKPVNLICGIIIWWPSLLWSYGPKEKQNFMMDEIKTNASRNVISEE